jgi:DNA invertase Pin-like site-specific DNA recombinase
MPRPSVAYVSSTVDQPPQAEAFAHDLELVEVVTERNQDSKAGLRDALALIADGTADTLFLPELGTAARSLTEMLRLLDWLEQADADLVAVRPPLDTTSERGRATVAVLREVERWEREPSAPRRPRGRPGLTSGSPKLARKLEDMRERGMSLQAIADQLNRDGVPTPRGGATWRPSSVQSALGYRRPRPPVPGAPPPKRPPPHRPPPPHGAPPHRKKKP